jgi:hypothetical protein
MKQNKTHVKEEKKNMGFNNMFIIYYIVYIKYIREKTLISKRKNKEKLLNPIFLLSPLYFHLMNYLIIFVICTISFPHRYLSYFICYCIV